MGNMVNAHIFKHRQVGEREEVRLKLFDLDGNPVDLSGSGGEEDSGPDGSLRWNGNFDGGYYAWGSVVRFNNHLYTATETFDPDIPKFGELNLRFLKPDPQAWSDGVITALTPAVPEAPMFTHADVWGFSVTSEGYYDVALQNAGAAQVVVYHIDGTVVDANPRTNQWQTVPPGMYVAVVGLTDESSQPYQIRARPHAAWDPKAVVSSDIGPTPENSPEWDLML